MENLVFLELKRQEKEVFFNKEGKECDFLIKEEEKITEAIQVSVSLEDEKTFLREVSGVLYAMNKYGLASGTILTLDEESVTHAVSKKIRIVPVWRWLVS